MIPILPELKSAMKQVTKQYQSDFDLDTKVIQKAAKEAKADGKPQTFLWFCRESGTYIARESNAYLKESPMYISFHYYADQQRREAKGIKAYVVTVTGLDGRKPLGFATPIDYFKECERAETVCRSCKSDCFAFREGDGRYGKTQDHPAPSQRVRRTQIRHLSAG